MKKEKKNSVSKIFSFHPTLFYVIPSFFILIFCSSSYAQGFITLNSTSTDVTEFLPTSAAEEAANSTQGNQLLEKFRGLIPNSIINTFSSTNKVVQTTNNTNIPSEGGADLFTKNLKLGDTDVEVLLLQKSLNEDTDTVVATSGLGSKGNETAYFGQKTKTAVIKLQEKHYGEVLAPNGLTAGTGYFGASTRAMMNNMKKTATKASPATLTSTIPNGPVLGVGETVKITSISPNHGKTGTVVTIHGSGMTPTANKVIAGEKSYYNISSSDGKTLYVTIESPLSLDFGSNFPTASSTYIKESLNNLKTASFPAFKAPICVLNDNGMSNCAFFTFDINI